MLERREECDAYLTHVCRHQCSVHGEEIKELSANTVTFINCSSRLTKVLAGATGEGGEERVRRPSEVTGC